MNEEWIPEGARPADEVNPRILDAIITDPNGAGCSPDAELVGVLVLSTWNEQGSLRIGVQTEGILKEAHAFTAIVGEILAKVGEALTYDP
jgi:hypothetical protein